MGGFEPEISDTIAGLIERGKPAWDVGANVGIVALLMANHGASEVLAFEPDQFNYSILLDQVQANPQLSHRVQPVRVAVSNYCGQVSFISNGASESHIASPEEANGKAIQCVTLDSILEKRPAPAFVKVDVEGAEVPVLEGASKLLSEFRPTFLIEVHSREKCAECLRILNAGRYDVRCLDWRDQNNGHVLATPRSKE
jgi:FkbM family methyltransferase